MPFGYSERVLEHMRTLSRWPLAQEKQKLQQNGQHRTIEALFGGLIASYVHLLPDSVPYKHSIELLLCMATMGAGCAAAVSWKKSLQIRQILRDKNKKKN